MTHQARVLRLYRATRTSRRRSLAAVVGSALLCAALLWLSSEHRHTLGHGLEALAALRMARTDLARGAADVALAASGATSDATQGLARIAQAVDGVERAESTLPRTDEDTRGVADVRRHLAALQQRVREGGPAGTDTATALMAALAALDGRAAALDLRLRTDLEEATHRAGVTFTIALVAALVLIVLMAAAIIAAERGVLEVFNEWREADREMAAVFDSLPALIWFKDRENRVRRVNAVAAAAAGRTTDQIEGRDADEVFPLPAPLHRAADQAVLDSGVPSLEALEQLPMPLGQQRWYRIDRVPYQGGEGRGDGLLVVARDVTDAKAADDRLLDERDRLAALAAATPSVLCSFRQAPDGAISMPYASPRITEIYGLGPEDLATDASALADLWHPDDRQRLLTTIAASKQSMTAWREEFRVLHPVKGEIWVEGHSVPFADADGGVTWHGSVTDVTERHRVQGELQQREELLEQAGRIAHIGGWEFDVVTGAGRWTAEVARIHDLDPAAPTSRDLGLTFYPGEARARVEAAIAGALAGTPYDIEVPFVSATGVRKWVRTSGRPVMKDGKVVRVRGAIHDVTERKEAEAAIQERLAMEQRLSMLAAMSPAVMYSFRLGPDGAMTFPYASERFGALFGVPAEDLVTSAEPALSRIHPEDLPRILASIQRSAQDGAPWVEELRFQHPTRGTVWVEGRSAPTRQADGATVWYGTLLDVTDRHQLEEELRQAQKLEAIGRLAGGVAHDFNNLLTVILGNATEMLDGVTDPELVQEIINASERAANLTKQLLLFSRKQVMQPTDIDLNTVLGDLTRMLQRILGEDIALKASFAPRLPTIHADQSMMEQLLLNLAVNSRDAMPDGGALHVSTRLSPSGATDPHRPVDLATGDYVCLSVHDTGTGIAPEILPRIFEPFFTTKDAGKGTGLGLATVYGIVKQHAGGISVESAAGEGATFHVYLPAAVTRVAARVPEPVAAPPRGGRAECVLVVEDEAPVRELAARVLQRDGYHVLTATSGGEAVQVWEAHPGEIALVITDLVMPGGMTGFALAERLAASRPDTRILFTSGYSRELSAGAATLVPGVDFLEKPYRLEQLLAIVRRRLDADPSVQSSWRVSAASAGPEAR